MITHDENKEELVIRVPVNHASLLRCIEYAYDDAYGFDPSIILEFSDRRAFIESMIRELEREDPNNGETHITKMLDASIISSIEAGAPGLEGVCGID